MTARPSDSVTMPRQDDLGLVRIANTTGLSISCLPNGAIFAIEHARKRGRIMINQVLASPIAGGLARLCLRLGGREPTILPLVGPEAHGSIGVAEDRFVWQGETSGVRHRVDLWLHPRKNLWLWRVEAANTRDKSLNCDAVLVQDLGLGDQGFLMGNEAYASQYIDHTVAPHPRMQHVVMSRQNLSQGGAHPWAAHGCVEGAAGFATDFRQVMGPAYRDSDQLSLSFGTDLPSVRLQGETACAALQSNAAALAPGTAATWTFFGFYQPDHPAASAASDLELLGDVERISKALAPASMTLSPPTLSVLQEATALGADVLDRARLAARYPRRTQIERVKGRLLSFFIPEEVDRRHVVMRDKERVIVRRHGALLRSGDAMLPDEETLCVTCWMHGVFGAQLTIGNTSFHQLFSISRDPYNIVRSSGLRILIDADEGWRLLTVPSVFEIGLSDCRWIYELAGRTVTISAIVSGDEPAVQWRVDVAGERCRFLVFGHLTLGEHEFVQAARMEIDAARKRFTFRPDPADKWGQRYPHAVYHLVTSTPDSIEAIGGDELLYADEKRRGGPFAALRTGPTNGFAFAVVGSMTDPERAASLAAKYSGRIDDAAMLAGALLSWRKVTRGIRIKGADAGAKAMDAIFPWLVHDAMIHLTVPHGLEQYTGAAWGTRDVCQGPIEMLLGLEHDEAVKAILRVLFAQQYEKRADWPQWFMFEPYSPIQDKNASGDVIIWPLKALCDYVETTGDLAFLDEPIAWRGEDDFAKSERADPVTTHVDRMIEAVQKRFVPKTHLISYGNGDWNDSLQPVDPAWRDWMASSWTVALLYQQLRRYAEILRRIGRARNASECEALASAIRDDFNRFLLRDGVVAGYGLFKPRGGAPELLLHPCDKVTGISYSLLPITQAVIGGIFTRQQTRRHINVVRKHLLFPDGAHLMDKPIAYHGGLETIFQRAESSAYFGREIGLMYTHMHLRYAETLATAGDSNGLWDALLTVNPIAVTERLANASLRQRNAYFSSSDAAFRDRYQASAEWKRVKSGDIAVDGGWRVYSSGPGITVSLLIQHVFGLRRSYGERIVKPFLPDWAKGLKLLWPGRLSSGSRRR